MINNRFLPLFLFTFLIHVTGYSQFDLVKDFNGSATGSFWQYDGGPLYAVGTKMLVQYDSTVGVESKNFVNLTAVDAAGNSQWLAYGATFPKLDGFPFFDFKTLPNGKVAFINIESGTSYKILVTDGTTAGTTAIYSTSRPIYGLELIDNGLYFTYTDVQQHALMKIELTNYDVTQVAAFGILHKISDVTKISDTKLAFLATDAVDVDQALKLYVSDGTSGGTTALAVINSGAAVTELALLKHAGNKVYFFSKLPDVECCSALWVTDGTVAGTQKIKELILLDTDHLISQQMVFGWKDKFYFAAIESSGSGIDPTLWVSDGTVAGTGLLMSPALENIHPRYFIVFKDVLYFITASGTNYTNKLYKTDGTAAGTVPVDLKYNEDDFEPYATMAADADYLYLGGRNVNSVFDAELFRYDGINSQCAMLEGGTGLSGAEPRNLFLHEDKLYFTARPDDNNTELYTIGGDFVQGITTSTVSAAALNSVLYPNPSKDLVTVKSDEQIVSLRLINQLGNTVTETMGATIDVSSYAAGSYTIAILFANNETIYQKLILNK